MYTADRLIGFGYDIDATCFYNTALETPSHLFFLALLNKAPCPSLNLLCSPTPPLARLLSVVMYCLVLPKVFLYVLNVCKFFIWYARNDFRFQGVCPGAPQLITKVHSRVGFHLSLLFKRYKSLRRKLIFHRQRGVAGIIGSVVDDRFVISSF